MRRPTPFLATAWQSSRGPLVPLTRTIRGYATEVTITADDHNGLDQDSAAQCQQIRSVATSRIIGAKGNVGSITLAQIRDTLTLLMDL